MICKILTYPNPILTKKTALATFPLSSDLMQDMRDSLTASSDGVALAANQIGHSISVILIGDSFYCNPRITWKSPETEMMTEACLSFPKLSISLLRALEVIVEYQDEHGNKHRIQASNYNAYNGELTEIDAQIFQHEIEHLSGKLFIDNLKPKKRTKALQQLAWR